MIYFYFYLFLLLTYLLCYLTHFSDLKFLVGRHPGSQYKYEIYPTTFVLSSWRTWRRILVLLNTASKCLFIAIPYHFTRQGEETINLGTLILSIPPCLIYPSQLMSGFPQLMQRPSITWRTLNNHLLPTSWMLVQQFGEILGGIEFSSLQTKQDLIMATKFPGFSSQMPLHGHCHPHTFC